MRVISAPFWRLLFGWKNFFRDGALPVMVYYMS